MIVRCPFEIKTCKTEVTLYDLCADLQHAFERVDHDGDGVINVNELEQIARSLNLKLSHSQAEAVVSRFGSKGQARDLCVSNCH